MSRRQTVIGLIACAAIAAGCGDDDTSTSSKDKAKPSAPPRATLNSRRTPTT